MLPRDKKRCKHKAVKTCAISKTLQAPEIAAAIWEANWFHFLLGSKAKLIASKLDVFPKIWLEPDVGRRVSAPPSRWGAISTNSSEYSQGALETTQMAQLPGMRTQKHVWAKFLREVQLK